MREPADADQRAQWLGYISPLGGENQPVTGFAEATRAIADFLKAIAWPAVAVFVVLRFKEQVGRLIDRFRKGAGAEFDPLPGPQRRPEPLTADVARTVPALERLRTQTVIQWEGHVLRLPFLVAEADPERRQEILLAIAARAALVSMFERTEANIWASQLELLNYLNASPDGEQAERLRELFYEPAAVRFPDAYRNYSFEGYLGFLQQSALVSVVDLRVTISPQGREYLLWRIEQQKPPRHYG